MIYRATYRDRVPVLVIMLALAAFFVSSGVIIHSLFLVVIGNSVVLFFVLTKLRLRLETSDEGLVYVNLLGRWEGKWAEIRRMKRMVDYGYPTNRSYTYWAYEFIMVSGKKKIISFFFLPYQALEEVKKKVKEQKSLSASCTTS